mgnify:CR=1 FL=1
MTIKTANGQTVEISCDGMMPAEVQVEGDKVTFKMNKAEAVAETPKVEAAEVAEPITEAPAEVAEVAEENDSADTFVEIDSVEVDSVDVATTDSLCSDSIADVEQQQSLAGIIANGLMEELSPEYKAFNEEHANDNPQEVLTNLANNLLGEEAVENIGFFSSMFSGLRFTKDSTFVATYEQRKPKPSWQKYTTVVLFGSFGKNIEGVSEALAQKVSEEDYGDDTENEHKFGGGGEVSCHYIKGSFIDGKWQPNPMGFGWSWGGLIDFSYEKNMGAYFSTMGKVGVQIGNDITFGLDALFGAGITPYNSFYTNGFNHGMLNKSAFCLKYGLQLWGSFNFSKNTYTIIYGRYIYSLSPGTALSNLPKDWELVVEDFDPSSWTIGLAVGYKFGAPQDLSTDKRLLGTFSTGYQFAGKKKGTIIAGELERLTRVSHSTWLTYGLSIEQLYGKKEDESDRYLSVLFSAGFKVNQPDKPWFWGAKAYLGAGDCAVGLGGDVDELSLSNTSKKLCAKTALQISGGIKLGKLSEIFGSCRLGFHFGKAIAVEGIENVKYSNLNGFEADARVGYRYTF